MIVTEYMENGSLDAFLRVCVHPAACTGQGEGSVQVLGGDTKPLAHP
jgi:hypothetical protein